MHQILKQVMLLPDIVLRALHKVIIQSTLNLYCPHFMAEETQED